MKCKYLKWTVFVIGVLMVIIFPLIIPGINDNIAYQTALDVKNIELPNETEYIEMFSAAGKLIGNGNGMQYLGGILVKSELPIEDIREYYAQSTNDEREYFVNKQKGRQISFIEHGTVILNTDAGEDSFYIVYTWGHSNSCLTELDIRGH